MPNVRKKESVAPSAKLIRKRERDLYFKQIAYWKKNWGLVVENEEEYKRIAEHSREIKKVLDIIPLIQSLKFVEKEE